MKISVNMARSIRALLTGAALLFAPSLLYCQDATSFLNEANYQIHSLGGIIYQVVIGVLSIVALVSLITLGIKMQSSDREGTNRALGWCGGLLFCIVMALLVKNFLGI